MLVTCTFTWMCVSTKAFRYGWFSFHRSQLFNPPAYFIMERKYMRGSSLFLSNQSHKIVYASEVYDCCDSLDTCPLLADPVYFFSFFWVTSLKHNMHTYFMHQNQNPWVSFPILNSSSHHFNIITFKNLCMDHLTIKGSFIWVSLKQKPYAAIL